MLNEDKFIDFNEEHLLNMWLISIILDVLNEDKSIDFKGEHIINIYMYIVFIYIILSFYI